jgi:hypothetical protein
MEMRAFQTKEKRLPTRSPSTKMSSLLNAPGARMEVSQYGGAESAAACSYVCRLVSTVSESKDICPDEAYRRLLLKFLSTSRLRRDVGKNAIIDAVSTTVNSGIRATTTRKEHVDLRDPTV